VKGGLNQCLICDNFFTRGGSILSENLQIAVHTGVAGKELPADLNLLLSYLGELQKMEEE